VKPMRPQLALVGGVDEPEIRRDAVLSPDGLYRYLLTREWDAKGRRVLFCMLNPSTADASKDDPTLVKCIGFARRWGFGSLAVVNLFAWRETDSTKLAGVRGLVGPANDAAIERAASSADRVVCAWGTKGTMRGRDRVVYELLASRAPHALRLTQEGAPEHPLYIPYDTKPTPWVPAWRATNAAPARIVLPMRRGPYKLVCVPSPKGVTHWEIEPAVGKPFGYFFTQASANDYLERVRKGAPE
jgi:hypothetical protein